MRYHGPIASPLRWRALLQTCFKLVKVYMYNKGFEIELNRYGNRDFTSSIFKYNNFYKGKDQEHAGKFAQVLEGLLYISSGLAYVKNNLDSCSAIVPSLSICLRSETRLWKFCSFHPSILWVVSHPAIS